jgi:hypothetical protein
VIAGDRQAIERTIAATLDQEELLQVKRRYPDYSTWETRTGAFASLQRAFGAGGKIFALARASEVMVQVTGLESGFCHVRLQADVSNLRRSRLTGALTLAGFGALATALAPVLGVLAPWVLLPLALGAMAGVTYARGQQRDAVRVQVALEQLLDRLEQGQGQPQATKRESGFAALGRLADEVRALLDPGPPARGQR